ncbi:glycoside hydrolase family 26 protein [Mycolicibacterium bacteremicum]|nr:glycosyl hydrolase [Mycolicibacterium bacteremicum]MCV7434569.1 endoglucanase [Mycolicibacterium bacteremicum]
MGLLKFGVTTPGGPCATAELDTVTRITGTAPQYVLWYEDFTAAPPLAELAAVARIGALPVITWEPWTVADRGPGTMRDLAAGALDDYVHEWIGELKVRQQNICLRFAHEFNGDWYPWSPAGGTPPEVHIAVWQRIHTMFAAAGATNVDFMWCADAVAAQHDPIVSWYPGGEFVDYIGVDGYNWGAAGGRHAWCAPAEIFGAALADARELAGDRPVVVAEVGCAEAGGSKARWITDLVGFLRDDAEVEGFIWFDHDKETDWRIASTAESATALAGALGGRA